MSTTTAYSPLKDIQDFMGRFVVFSDEAHAEILSLWVLHTWTFDAAYATPYIYVNSAEPQSGKTRTMEVAMLLARSPQQASNLTTASLFRRMAEAQPTLFIDEVDTIFSGSANEELRGVLNSGYKSGAFVSRFTGKEVEDFPTFCPKMLVGIDNAHMPDTLRDRCIPFNLKRKKAGQEVERFIPRKVEPQAEELRGRIEKWAMQNMERIMDAPEPKIIDNISDRKFEVAEPLLVLARICGKAHENSVRKHLERLLAGETPKASAGVQALQAAKELMEEGKMDKLPTATLANHLGFSPKKLGVVLAPFGIAPETLRFPSGEKLKGYRQSAFVDAWERYL